MVKTDKETDRLPQIDFLRGVAALGVFIFHVAMAVGFDKRVLPPISFAGKTWSNIPSVVSLGASGVSLFFVISGFCLALKPFRAGAGSIPFLQYARHRFARVYPAYFVAVLFSLMVSILLGHEWSALEGLTFATFFQGFIQKWHFGINGALWSMSTEVQFYALFPLVFLFFAKSKPRKYVAAIFVATLAFRAACAHLFAAGDVVGGINTGTFLMNMIPGRLFEFVLGMYLADHWVKNKDATIKFCQRIFLPALAFGLFARMRLPTWIADPALGVMCVGFVGIVINNRYLGVSGALAAFGRASYSFFLLHVPVILLVLSALGDGAGSSLYGRFAMVSVIAFSLTLVLSAGLYRYVELGAVRYMRPSAARDQLLSSNV